MAAMDQDGGARPALGLAWGLLTLVCWSGYNLAAEIGIQDGFRPTDLATLRFGVAGLVLAPLAVVAYGAAVRRIGLARLAFLSLLAGPPFGVVSTSGFHFAPLSHALVFAPTAVLATSLLWARLYGQPGFTRVQYAGAVVLLAGLVVLSGFDVRDIGLRVLIGDAIFVLGGSMWGTFTFFLAYWRLDPAPVTCGVGAMGLVQVVAFVVLAQPGLPPVPGAQIAFQAGVQGLVGGVAAVFTYAFAVRHLGGARVSVMPSFTPVVAFVLAFLFLGQLPDTAELAGSLLACAGLAVILGSRGAMGRIARPRT